MPLIVDKNQIRNKILEAFERCLQKKPILKVSMRDIAAEVGISHAKILYYFESKQELIQTYIDYFTGLHIEFIRAWLKEQTFDQKTVNPRQMIGQLFCDTVAFEKNKKYYNVFIQIYPLTPYDPQIKESVQAAYRNWKTALQELLGTLYGRNMDKQAEAIYVLFEGVLLYSNYYPLEDMNIVHILDTLCEL